MKLVITVDHFDPNKGYLEYYLAQQLSRLGHKVFVFTFAEGGTVSRTKRSEGFDEVRIPYLAKVNGQHIPTLRGIRYVIGFIKTEKPDVVHCQPLYSPLSLLFVWLRRVCGYGIVGSLVTGEMFFNGFRRKVMYSIAKAVVKRYLNDRVDTYFAINEGFRNALLQLFGASYQKIRVIPLGADSELFHYSAEARARLRNALRLLPEDIVVIYSGRIIPEKGLPVLVKAIATLIRKDKRVKLLIVGKGEQSYLRNIEELCLSLGISDNVILHEWVHRSKLPEFYSASDVAVWPAGLSISILEAASVGLPLIVSRSPVLEYTLSYKNGFAFKRGNTGELRKYLWFLIHNKRLRSELGHRSRMLIEQSLNWRTIAIQFIDAYALSVMRHTSPSSAINRAYSSDRGSTNAHKGGSKPPQTVLYRDSNPQEKNGIRGFRARGK